VFGRALCQDFQRAIQQLLDKVGLSAYSRFAAHCCFIGGAGGLPAVAATHCNTYTKLLLRLIIIKSFF